MQEQNQKRRQAPNIRNSVPDAESKTVSSTHLKTAAAASNKSASIFSENQNAEQSHETHIINSLREQLIQLGLSKYEIEMKYEKYLPIAARAIIEKPETLCSLRQRLVNDLEAVAAEIFKSAETKTSHQDDVTLEQEPINNCGKHSPIEEQTESFLPNPYWFIPDGTVDYNLDHIPKFRGEPIESEYDDTLVQSYVAEVVTESAQTQINDALAYVAAHNGIPRLHESINDIAAAFAKLARVLDIKCSGNDDFYLVLFEIWQKLYKK